MTNRQVGNVIALSALAVIILWLLNENSNSKKENAELRRALNSNNLISDQLRSRLLALLAKHPHIDEDVKIELQSIALLLGLQQEAVAILKLAKIIENLLKRLYKTDSAFREWLKAKNKKRAFFADYLDHAHEQKVISKEDYHLISILKVIRNEEAHEMNVVKDRAKMVGCFMAGISVTIELYNQMKKRAA